MYTLKSYILFSKERDIIAFEIQKMCRFIAKFGWDLAFKIILILFGLRSKWLVKAKTKNISEFSKKSF